MKQFLFILMFLIGLSSCSDFKKTERLRQITSMEKSLDSLDKIMLKLKVDSLEEMQLAAQMVELQIKNNLKVDSIDLEFGKKLDAYKIMRKSIPKFQKNTVKMKQGIKEIRNTLKSLKFDIENSSGKREKYDEYITFEKKKVNQLEVMMKYMEKSLEKIIQTYKKLHPELSVFSNSLVSIE